MPTVSDAALQTLAEQTAATIHATVRRWWRDPVDERLLQIATERAFVGARPIAVHFTVRLKTTQPVAVAGRPRMRVGVSLDPPSIPARPVARPPVTRGQRRARSANAPQRKKNDTARPRARATVATSQPRKPARPSGSREQRQVTSRAIARKKPRRSARG